MGDVVVVGLYVLTEDGLNVLLMFLIGIIVGSGAEKMSPRAPQK